MKKINAFTLAEVLTTLVIIGIIAAITVPILQSSISDHILEKQQKVFERKFDQNMHVMQLKGVLSKRYANTMDFAKVMQQYMNITKVCDKEHLSECFSAEIMQNKRQMKYDVTKLRVASDVDIQFSNESDLVGLVFADGVSAIIAQDPECLVIDKYNQTADVSYCLGMIYDVNGTEGPNMIDQDILTMNVGSKAIDIEIISVTSGLSIERCEDAKNKFGAPITYCEVNNDLWANAALICHQKGKRLPTRQELKEIATSIYGQPIALTGPTNGLTVSNTELWEKIGSPSSGDLFWSAEEYSGSASYYRYFDEAYTNCTTHHGSYYGSRAGNSLNPIPIHAFCICDDKDECGKNK